MARVPKVVGRKQNSHEGLTMLHLHLRKVFPSNISYRRYPQKGGEQAHRNPVTTNIKKGEPCMGELRIMRGRREPDGGDARLTWDRNNDIEVSAAKAMWDKLKREGFLGYRVKGDAGKGEVIDKFDPDAEKLIMSPPLVGG